METIFCYKTMKDSFLLTDVKTVLSDGDTSVEETVATVTSTRDITNNYLKLSYILRVNDIDYINTFEIYSGGDLNDFADFLKIMETEEVDTLIYLSKRYCGVMLDFLNYNMNVTALTA